MIPDLPSVLLVGFLVTPVFLFLMFVPTAFEWNNPKDTGPRHIMDEPYDPISDCDVSEDAGKQISEKP